MNMHVGLQLAALNTNPTVVQAAAAHREHLAALRFARSKVEPSIWASMSPEQRRELATRLTQSKT